MQLHVHSLDLTPPLPLHILSLALVWPTVVTVWCHRTYRIAGIFHGGLISAVFAVGHHPRKFNPRILSGYEIPRVVRSAERDEPSCVDMALFCTLDRFAALVTHSYLPL